MSSLNKIPKTGTYGTAVDAMNENFTLIQQSLAEGYSPYQVWLDQGNEGTEQDFLDSLKGADGIDGVVLDPTATTIFDSLDDLKGKTDEQKASMIPSGNVIEEIPLGTFSTGEEVDEVSLFDELSDLEGKTDEQKNAMIPSGSAIEGIADELVVSAGGSDIKGDITWINGGLNKTTGNTNTDTNFIRAGNDIMQYDKNLLISHGSDEGSFYIRICYYDANDTFLRYRDVWGNCYVEAGTRFRFCIGHNPVQTITDYTTDTVYTKLSVVLGGRSREQNYINNTKPTAMAIYTSVVYDAAYRSGYPILIPSGVTSITVKPSVPKGQYVLGFYDASFAKIAQYTNNQNDYAPRTVTVDSGAVYFCIQSGNNDLETWAKDQEGNILWEPLTAVEETMPIREAVEELMAGGGGSGGGGGRYDDLLSGYIYDGIRQLSNASLTLLHFSDIHGDAVRLARIMTFAKRYSDIIDNIIQTGDLVSSSWSSGIDFYTGVEGTDKILNVIGNHDSASSNSGGWTDYTAAQCAARYITPFVSNWGVTIGSDVCYYYKDYDNGIRLIVLDRLHFDATQKSWLLALLQSSTAKKVIIACHNVPGAVVANKACNMDVFWKTAAQDSYMTLDSDVLDAVDTFMSGGGVFICWLTGHTHYDLFRLVDGHPNQLCVTVGSASLNAIAQTYVREAGTRSEDNFNLFSVDLARGTLCVQKCGCSRDSVGRSTFAIAYDYINHAILMQQ